MELCSMLCSSLDRRRVWGRMDTCVCMAESVHCSPETTTILLISYIQYKMLLVLKKDKNLKKILRFLKWSTSKKKKRIILHVEMIQKL